MITLTIDQVILHFLRACICVLLFALPTHIAAQQPADARRTYVIVHGAWGGSWDWQQVDSLLTERGHRVHRVALTGLGQRAHLSSPRVGLQTHVDDVVNAVVWENLRDIVLVGHSYGGMVITGAADRIANRIGRLVYVDAMLPDSGETVLGIMPGSFVATVTANTRAGMVHPVWQTDTLTVPRDLPHPAKTFLDTLHFSRARVRSIPTTYVFTYAAKGAPDAFQSFAERATARGLRVVKIEGDHAPHRSQPRRLVDLLIER